MQFSLTEQLESRVLLSSYVVDITSDTASDVSGAKDGRVSLREAIIASNTNAAFGDAVAGSSSGDSIRFASSIFGSTIAMKNGQFAITDDLLIDGTMRGITIDAGGASRIYAVNTSERVELANHTLSGGKVAGEGGAVSLAGGGTTFVSGMRIANSTASGMGGGGIYNADHRLTVNSSVIDGNVANGAAGSGGALLSTSGKVDVVATRLMNNVANRAGGAIELVNGTLGIDSSGLTDNVAGPNGSAAPGNGGALHVTGTNAAVNIFNTLVQGNHAVLEGGGLWNQGGVEMVVTQSKIDANTASGAAADDGGGGIFNNGGNVTVINSLIDDNVADGTSGSGGNVFSTAGSVLIDRSTVSDGTANRAGGGVEVIAGRFTLSYSDLTGNVAGPSGSANPGNGGGLHVSGAANVTIDSSNVLKNAAALEGGGLWNQAGATHARHQLQREQQRGIR